MHRGLRGVRVLSWRCSRVNVQRWAKKMSTSTTSTAPEPYKLVQVQEVNVFVQRALEAAGAAAPHAASLAEVLVAADRRGHFSHGLNRLEMYVREMESGMCDGIATPQIMKETPATAYVNGRNGVGPVVGTFCMDLAIKKAKEVGVGWVTCTGSNHYGIAGYYSLRAVNEGLIGMAVTNTSPVVVPTRAKQTTLGTNPFTFAAPAKKGDPFVLDMATSTAALGKVEIQHMKEQPIPSGWGVDSSGKESNDPAAVLSGGGLMHLGGSEASAGYKGYGLAMMVEVMCGIMGGGPYAHHIRKWTGDASVANLGQAFIAVDPGAFAPNFEERMGTFMEEMRQLEPVEPEKPVLVAGDPERMHEEKVEREGGIWYHNNLIAAVNTLALKLNVDPIKIVS